MDFIFLSYINNKIDYYSGGIDDGIVRKKQIQKGTFSIEKKEFSAEQKNKTARRFMRR